MKTDSKDISSLRRKFLNEVLEQDEVYLRDLIKQKASKQEIEEWKQRVSDLKKCIYWS